MKNQYFGDINDYLKYGLLRAIIGASNLRTLVGWMLTHDDPGTDGRFVSYLENSAKWARHDPDLFTHLKEMLAQGAPRRVGLMERSLLLPGAKYFSAIVPDSAEARSAWFRSLLEQSQGRELVFLDPDNGLEVPLANGYRNRRSQKSDGIFAADWYERKMAFPRPEDKEKREAWAHPLRGARV